MISVGDLTKRFGDIVAVDGIDLEIQRGEIVGFVGPNGAGKTTTLKVITGYLRAESGIVKVAGHDVTADSLEVRRRIGYLPETCPLYDDMRVIDFLRYIAEVRGIPAARRKAQISKVVDICGLVEVLMKGIGELSKGFRQRTGLAQAMVHEPEILLLDEPTSGLDPNQVLEIREPIREIGKEKTVVLSTHILPEVTATCGRVIIIHGGKIVADGTLEELQKKAPHGRTVHVRLKGDSLEGVEKGLGALPRVQKVKVIDPANRGERGYEVTPKGAADITDEIFRYTVESNLILRELRVVGATLQDVFHHLTRG